MRRIRHQGRRRAAAASGTLPTGTEFTAQVRDISAEGTGVVPHESGQVFFVPGVWQNEEVQVRVTGFKGRFGFADLVQVLRASPERLQPPCPYQGFDDQSCGGCPWQFMSYPAQLRAKQARVEQAFASMTVAGAVRPIAASPQVFRYRNRAQFKTDGQRLGYMAARSRRLVDVEHCLILTDANEQTLAALRERLPEKSWRPGRGQDFTTLDIDETVNAASVSVNQRLPFRQANSDQNGFMQSWLAHKLAGLDREKPVLELFAGSGNFTQVIAQAAFARILAVEVAEPALAELHQRLPVVETLVTDLFSDAAARQIRRRMPDAEVLVLDPPRDGLRNDLLKSAEGLFHKRAKLSDVFYISCNLATLCRDLRAFLEQDFRVTEVQPLDQFPHTPHIELMVHLQKC